MKKIANFLPLYILSVAGLWTLLIALRAVGVITMHWLAVLTFGIWFQLLLMLAAVVLLFVCHFLRRLTGRR